VSIVAAAWLTFSYPRRGATVPAPRQNLPRASDLVNSNLEPSAQPQPSSAAVTLIDDDGQTLWVSPTAGRPLDLAHLAPGAQLIVVIRPDALADHPEGTKILDSLGPLGKRAMQRLNELSLVPRRVKQLIVGLEPIGDGGWRPSLVAQLTDSATAEEHLATKLSGATSITHRQTNFRLASGWAYYIPSGGRQRLVIAPAEAMAEIIDLEGQPPPLRRDVARLLGDTDADRHITIVVAPNTLFSEGQIMFNGPLAALREPLFQFLGDEISAAALSMHWDDNFFMELLVTPTLDTSPARAAGILAKRLAQIPDRLEELVVGLDPHPYGRRIVARFPAVVRKLVTYTRNGFDADHAVLRSYLPAIAGHNLLMGAELTLAELAARSGTHTTVPAAALRAPQAGSAPRSTSPMGARERLQRVTSLVFARDTLEAALGQLADDIGVEIVIRGGDLQSEGITKNQSFRIEMVDEPAEQILVEILRLANPDKTVSRPSDDRQKLVYVVASPLGAKRGQIIVTTRARAAERGDELPAVFRSN
jgi:hypothetical protein